MPLFAHLANDSIKQLTALKPQILTEVERFKQQTDKLKLNAQAWQIGALGDIRSVHIYSEKIEISNFFFFPYADYALPCYALEFVRFSVRPVVGIIDLIGLNPDVDKRYSQLMQTLRVQSPLPQSADIPAWYQDCRSGDDFFIRPQSDADLLHLHKIHHDIWQQLQPMFSQAVHCKTTTKHAKALQHYKQHHQDNIPGVSLLNKSFGQAWTQQFLGEYLFA